MVTADTRCILQVYKCVYRNEIRTSDVVVVFLLVPVVFGSY